MTRPHLDHWDLIKDQPPEQRAVSAYLLWVMDNDPESATLITRLKGSWRNLG